MRNFQIRRSQQYKNYVFLLSVFEGSAFWTAHEYEGRSLPLSEFVRLFQSAHNTQVEGLILQAEREEPEEFRNMTIDDQTKKN